MVKTIIEALNWASSFLENHGIEQGKREAELLLMELFHWDKNQLLLNLQQAISEEKKNTLEHWLNRRMNHEPLQYIVEGQEFYGRRFFVNSDVLIPRPETELLVEQVILEAKRIWDNRAITIIDIGTGSGAIPITISAENQAWKIHSVDISNKALAVASKNAEDLNVSVQFHHGNILEPIINKEIKADVIVSNPPYIPSQEIRSLMKEVRDYEPWLALDGGDDGLSFYKEIIKQSKQVLNNPGLIAFEVGIYQSESLKKLLLAAKAKEVKIIKDYQGIERIVVGFY